jgi:hypothetical protein
LWEASWLVHLILLSVVSFDDWLWLSNVTEELMNALDHVASKCPQLTGYPTQSSNIWMNS